MTQYSPVRTVVKGDDAVLACVAGDGVLACVDGHVHVVVTADDTVLARADRGQSRQCSTRLCCRVWSTCPC